MTTVSGPNSSGLAALSVWVNEMKALTEAKTSLGATGRKRRGAV